MSNQAGRGTDCCWNAFRDVCKGRECACRCHVEEKILKQIPMRSPTTEQHPRVVAPGGER